jgi:import receptor subunit TOM22
MRFGVRSARFLGNGAWILTTSALLIFMPLAYEIEREHAFDQAYSQMENEQQLVNLCSALNTNLTKS